MELSSNLISATSNAGKVIATANEFPIRLVLTEDERDNTGKYVASLNGMAGSIGSALVRVLTAMFVAVPDYSAPTGTGSSASRAKTTAYILRRYSGLLVADETGAVVMGGVVIGGAHAMESVLTNTYGAAANLAQARGLKVWETVSDSNLVKYVETVREDNLSQSATKAQCAVWFPTGDPVAPESTDETDAPETEASRAVAATLAAGEGGTDWEVADRLVTRLVTVWADLTADERTALADRLATFTGLVPNKSRA